MKILITGALGYLGTELLSQLIDEPLEIIAIDNSITVLSINKILVFTTLM